jgi:predicted nuclease of predicted toxin-antitoxin system
MKLLVDMNLSPTWIAFLVQAGFASIHWSSIGRPDASDAEVMRWAAEHDCIVLTADLDFGAALAATRARRPSVVQIRSDILTTTTIGAVVVAALRQAEQELLAGALVSVDASRMRLRILPLRG